LRFPKAILSTIAMTLERINSCPALALAEGIAGRFAAIIEVEAVALAGSRTSPFADSQSDLDLYVYADAIVPTSLRAEIVRNAPRAEIGNSFWEPGDEWIDADSGISIDVMFRTTRWIQDRLDSVLQRHEASVGYSTCFWYNVRNSRALFDRSGWFKELQEKASQPYPEALQRAIVAKNYPILRSNLSSYLRQIELAVQRHDPVSLNHRAAAMLASYFDIVFAVNAQPHPGEKRLIELARALCLNLPSGMAEQVTAFLSALPNNRVTERANAILEGLDELLRRKGFL
jgi:Domain of unknown function (DUF4037)